MGDCFDKINNCILATDSDGGPVQCVGMWAKDKHHYLANYIAATRNVRAMYNEDGGSSFIDLFSGNGRARIRETKEIIDGSPLIAINAAPHGFTDIVLAELAEENAYWLRQRTSGTRRVRVVEGDCNAEIDRIIAMLPRRGYHVALLDPFAASALKFETVRRLAAFPRMDLIIHFPTGSMKRNFENYRSFEPFMGLAAEDWGFDIVHGDDVPRLIEVYRRQLMTLGYADKEIAVNSPPIKSGSNVLLYNLVFASKHERGDQIWNSVTRNAPSGQMDLFR